MPKKNQVKIKYTISLKSIFNLPAESVSNTVWVAWKRGSKSANKGESKHVLVDKERQALLNEEFMINSTMTQDEKTKAFDAKKIEFTFKEVRPPRNIHSLTIFFQEVNKKTKPLGKVVVNLAEYTATGNRDTVTIPLVLKKKTDKGPSLKVLCITANNNLLIVLVSLVSKLSGPILISTP